MRFTKLGNSGIDVSVIGFGAWAIGGKWWGGNDEDDSIAAIEASLDSGINFIDTAPAYGQGLSEELITRAIKGKRDKVVIATKCGLRWDLEKGSYFFEYSPGVPIYRYLGMESIEHELDLSLKRLNTDYIDLYQSHWQDPTTPISETMETFLKLKEKGKIRAIGVSNASMEDLKEYVKYGVLDTDQEKYSIIDTEVEAEILPWCHERNVSMLAYSPVSKGLLTGKMDPLRSFSSDDSRTGDPRFSSKNIERANMLLEKHLKGITEKYSISYGHIASAWITKDPKNIALCGARNKAQAIENALSGDLVLDDDDLRKIQQFKNEYEENIR